jgi:hydroxyacylglutathione hydrolase
VVDLRSRTAFAAGHLRGSRHFELGDSFVTYLGWLIPWGTPLTLLGQTPAEVVAAQRDLARIGIDRPAAASVGRPEDWTGGEPLRRYPVADFAAFEQARGRAPAVLLDVRRHPEWRSSRIEGALHVPLHELPGRLGELPGGRIWVHCQSGYRASVAASWLDAAGLDVVLIDEDFSCAERSGLASTPAGAPA